MYAMILQKFSNMIMAAEFRVLRLSASIKDASSPCGYEDTGVDPVVLQGTFLQRKELFLQQKSHLIWKKDPLDWLRT